MKDDRDPEQLPPTSRTFVQALSGEIREIQQRALELFGDLDEAALSWSPSPKAWSVGECLEHLLRTNALYLRRMRMAASRLEPPPGDTEARIRGGLVGRWFARSVGPDLKWRLPAPPVFRPRPPPSADDSAPSEASGSAWMVHVVREFAEQQDQILAFLDEVAGLPLDRARFASPAFRLFRLRLTDGLRAMTAHQWRHLAQAERVLRHPDFPGRDPGGER